MEYVIKFNTTSACLDYSNYLAQILQLNSQIQNLEHVR